MLDVELIGTARAAHMLGVSPKTIRRWVEAGELGYASRVDGTGALLFNRAAIVELAERRIADARERIEAAS